MIVLLCFRSICIVFNISLCQVRKSIRLACQLSRLERRANNAKVMGSIPLRATTFVFAVPSFFCYSFFYLRAVLQLKRKDNYEKETAPEQGLEPWTVRLKA